MPNQKQFDTSLQSIRNIDCKLFVIDYDYTVIDEISGKTESVNISVDAESDIRRTADINITLKDDSRQSNSNTFYWVVGNPYWFDKYLVALVILVVNAIPSIIALFSAGAGTVFGLLIQAL